LYSFLIYHICFRHYTYLRRQQLEV